MNRFEKLATFGIIVLGLACVILDLECATLQHKIDVYKLTCVQVDLSRSSELTNAIVLQFKKP